MNSSLSSPPTFQACAEIRKFGYAISQKIGIYGEEFEVLPDPFPNDGGVAIKVRSGEKSVFCRRPLAPCITMITRRPCLDKISEPLNGGR